MSADVLLPPQPTAVVLVPIVVTLVLSLWTRNVIVGLFVGVLTGVGLLHGFEPLTATQTLIRDYLVEQLLSRYNAAVLVLLVFIGGFVHLMETSGGGPAFAARVIRTVNSQRKAKSFAWLGGLFIFYSDIGTPLIIGPVFRPLFDKLKLSREKLALIIDSTASPVAVLIPFIGWGVYIMSLIEKELPGDGFEQTAFELFLAAIPYQFYAILAVAMVPALILARFDFGPMREAERRAASLDGNRALGEDAAERPPKDASNTGVAEPFRHERASASFVFVPLLVMAATLLISLVPLGFPQRPVSSATFLTALASAYFFAALSLMALVTLRGVRTPLESITLYLKGMNGMMQIVIILILAWTLSVIGKDLGAPQYIAGVVEAGVPGWSLPACVFLLGSLISFATGSSWGTFAILFPLVIPAALAVDAPLIVVIAAVLSGGLFGDHSSPISETTILSSTGAGCAQYEHFRTQLPYALANGCLALSAFLSAGVQPSSLWVVAVISAQLLLLFFLKRMYSERVPHESH